MPLRFSDPVVSYVKASILLVKSLLNPMLFDISTSVLDKKAAMEI